MSQFIPYQPNQNQGFQQGWNMIMNLYGKKQISERTEQMKKEHEDQLSQMQKAFALKEKTFAANQKVRDEQLKEYQRKEAEATTKVKRNAMWEDWLTKNPDASKKEIAIKRTMVFPEEGIPKLLQKEETGKYKKGELKDFKIGDEYVQHKFTGNVVPGAPPGWEPTGVKAPRYKPTTNINIGAERFGLQKEAEAGKIRSVLTQAKGDEDVYASNAQLFNKLNTKNEVAYWDSKAPGITNFKGTKIIKLSPGMIKEGWSPSEIQRVADTTGETVEQVLMNIGALK